jgi:hypothetical protein
MLYGLGGLGYRGPCKNNQCRLGDPINVVTGPGPLNSKPFTQGNNSNCFPNGIIIEI